MIGELIINNLSLDLEEGIPFPLNFSISDIKEPQKRKRNFSKTLTLPGTEKNLNFFSSTYQLALSTVDNTTSIGFNYDPTIRISAKYYNNGDLNFNGLFRLDEVILSNGSYSFKCTLFSNFIDLFMKLGNLKVSELGWSEYDHLLTRTNITNSFATSVKKNAIDTVNFTAGVPDGFGYLYGLVEYGYNKTTPTTYNTSDIVPMVYCKEIIEKCLQISDISYTSAFLDSDLFKKRMFAFGGGEKIALPPLEVLNRKVQFTSDFNDLTGNVFVQHLTADPSHYRYIVNRYVDFYAGWNGYTFTYVTDNYDQFYFDHTAPTSSTHSNEITIAKTGKYNLNIVTPVAVTYDLNGMGDVGGFINYKWEILRNGAVIDSQTETTNDITVGYFNTFTYNNDLQLNNGDTIGIRFQVYLDYVIKTVLGVSTPQSLDVLIVNDTVDFTFELTSVQGTLQENDPVTLSRFIPDMKASTFLEGIILADNLYMSDPDLFDNVNIEPLNDFYQETTEFWDITQIVDHSKPIVIKPSSSIQGKVYKFQWLTDNDYDNSRYRNFFGIDYGNHWYTVPSTFQTGERVYQLPFAQTIPTDQNNSFVIPRIISFDPNTNTVKPFKGKPRLYLYNGLKAGSWRITDAGGTGYSDLTTYPCLHHFDDWENPTFDLNWGLPILFSYNATIVTTDNLYTRQHERFIKEITGKDSKIVNLYLKLNSNDINTLDFSLNIMWNGSLFRLNEIKDFDPNTTSSTQVELVKILQAKNRIIGSLISNELTETFGTVESPSGVGGDTGVIIGGVEDDIENLNTNIIYGG